MGGCSAAASAFDRHQSVKNKSSPRIESSGDDGITGNAEAVRWNAAAADSNSSQWCAVWMGTVKISTEVVRHWGGVSSGIWVAP